MHLSNTQKVVEKMYFGFLNYIIKIIEDEEDAESILKIGFSFFAFLSIKVSININCRSPPIKSNVEFDLVGRIFVMSNKYNLNNKEKSYLKKIIINARNKYFDKNKFIENEIVTDWNTKDNDRNIMINIKLELSYEMKIDEYISFKMVLR